MARCMFCEIAAGDIPAKIVHADDQAIAFRDIDPKAPTHVLVIPREHIATVNDLTGDHEPVVGRLFTIARQVARDEGLADDGYRLVMNCGQGAGQSVFHIHLHLLGGRHLSWPPG
jgi:histidine triad (HIT) family protein